MSLESIDIVSLEKELNSLREEDLLRDPKILEILLSRRIYGFKYGEYRFYVYRSGREDHIIIPKIMCTCPDFIMNVIMRRRRSSCIHLRALELAIKKSYVKEIVLNRDRFEKILYDVISSGRLSEELPQE